MKVRAPGELPSIEPGASGQSGASDSAWLDSRASPVRVLFVVGNFNSGGSERQALETARLLFAKACFDVQFACLDRSGPLLDSLRGLGMPEPLEFPISSFSRPGTLAQAARFARHVRRERVEIVHCHEFYSNVFGLFSASLARTPVRIGSRRNTGGSHASTSGRRRLEHAAFRTAHAVLANGAAVRDSLASEGFRRDRIAVVPNSVNVERFLDDRALPLPPGIPAPAPGTRWITCVANMRHPVKDQDTLLRAARNVVESEPGVEFVLVGEGELTRRYEKLARTLGIEQRVHFTGAIEDVAPVLRASSICTLTSRREGMSNALLEYQAAGRPVVATDVGAASEIVLAGKTGLLVPPGDPDALAGAYIELLRDPEAAEAMGRRGREHVARTYSGDALVNNLARLYGTLLGERVA